MIRLTAAAFALGFSGTWLVLRLASGTFVFDPAVALSVVAVVLWLRLREAR